MILSKCSETESDAHLGLMEGPVSKYPRLMMAISQTQKEFIAHPHCQKVLEDLYHPAGKETFIKVVWTTALQVLLYPFIAAYMWLFLSRGWILSERHSEPENVIQQG